MKNALKAALYFTVVLAGILFFQKIGGLIDTRNANAPFTQASSAALEDAIAQEMAKLPGLPRTVTLTSERGLDTRKAIIKGDFAQAGKIASEVLAQNRTHLWYSIPADLFISAVPDVNDPDLGPQFDAWVAKAQGDIIPLLLRGEYFYRKAWNARGTHFMREVQAGHLEYFAEYMEKAAADADAVLRIDAKEPHAMLFRLQIAAGGGNGPEMEKLFQEAVAAHPESYQLYYQRLRTLAPKWGGSEEEQVAFVEKHAGTAPQYSPLKMLYLDLYTELLDAARVRCWKPSIAYEEMKKCVGQGMAKFTGPRLDAQIHEALDLYNHTDKYEFTIKMKQVLNEAQNVYGADSYSSALLQLAADTMGSENQLHEDHPGHNNYMLDLMTAHNWYRSRGYDNAEKKYKEAIEDLRSAPFPSEEERLMELMDIYNSLGNLYSRMSQYREAIVYLRAAEALGGNGSPLVVCENYYSMKAYAATIAECTKAMKKTGSMEARYWRALGYQMSGKKDAALEDYAAVAESESSFRTSAVINISALYGERNDYKAMADVFNAHPFAFDERSRSKNDLAFSYNNRCYAYLHLGELEKALADCTMSLKFGNMPDAYQKQQEIIKRLKAHEKGV